MLIEGQKIKTRWASRNREHYESLGYKYTKYNDEFTVDAKHLMSTSRKKVEVQCDYCNNVNEIGFANYYKNISKGKYSCVKCGKKKNDELFLKKNGHLDRFGYNKKKIKGNNIHKVIEEVKKWEDQGFECQHPIQKREIFDDNKNFVRMFYFVNMIRQVNINV